jgi:hypothetical protein
MIWSTDGVPLPEWVERYYKETYAVARRLARTGQSPAGDWTLEFPKDPQSDGANMCTALGSIQY